MCPDRVGVDALKSFAEGEVKNVFRTWGCLVICAALWGCADLGQKGAEHDRADGRVVPLEPASDAWNRVVGNLLQTPEGHDPWQPFPLPGKRFAAFELVESPSGPVLSVQADRSVSILRQRISGAGVGPTTNLIDFSWKVDGLPEGAKLSESDREDSPVRVLLSFDGDRGTWSARNHRLSEMSRLLTGEELPYATLMYVWSNHDAPETVVVNPRTDRIRKVVVESGAAQVGHWRKYRRDIRADFVRAFGEEPGPLRAVALMTDTDNTRTRLRAWYGPLVLGAR